MSYPDKSISSLDGTYLKYQMAKYIFKKERKFAYLAEFHQPNEGQTVQHLKHCVL